MASMITLSQSKSPCVKVVCSQSLRLLLENMSGGVGGFDSNIQPPKEIYKNMVGEIIVGATTCKYERHYNEVPTNKKTSSNRSLLSRIKSLLWILVYKIEMANRYHTIN